MKPAKIITFSFSLLTTIVSAIIGIVLDIEKSITIPICWWSMSIICVVILGIIITIAKIIKAKQDYKTKKSELEQEKAKINNLSIGDPSAIGNAYLLMALSQNMYEPLKFEMLRISAEKHNNVFAGVILGCLYETGVQSNGKSIIDQDYDQAFNLYKKLKIHDPYGMTDWMIGWFYESNVISDSKKMTKEERLSKALEYYKLSSNKGYPKAFNSIGKFYLKGLAGLPEKRTEAIGNFKKAADLGDAYAIMNCGHLEMERYFEKLDTTCLNNAEHYFQTAEVFNSPEALLHLGIICEEKVKINSANSSFLNDAKKYYIRASAYTNKFSATSFYKLGCLIRDNVQFKNDKEIIAALGQSQHTDLAVECFIRAYSMFEELEQSNKLNGKYINYFNDLKNSFCNASNNFDYTGKTTV